MVLYFVVGSLILEAITFSILDLGFMPEYFLYNLSIILVIAFLVFIVPNYICQYVVYTVLLVAQAVLAYINYSLSRVYGDLISIEMVRLIGEAGAAMTSSFVYIAVALELVLVSGILITAGALLLRYCRKDKNTIKQHYSVFCVILILSAQLFGVGFSIKFRDKVNAHTSISDIEYSLSDKFLMNTSILKTSSYQKFGTYGYFTNMFANAIRNEGNAIDEITIDYFNGGKIYGTSENKSQVFGIDEGNNVIVIMMESLEWFGFGDGNYDPSFNNLIYDDPQIGGGTLTPNITKLIYGENYLTATQSESLLAKNFFAKSKTNMSEGQGIIGNYPIAQSLKEIVDNDSKGKQALGYAMPSVMQRMGYTTTYVHSHNIEFYSRGDTHSHLGFDRVIGKNDIKDSNGEYVYTGDDLFFDNWDAEGAFAQNAIDYIIPTDQTKPFYTFYLNVSSHGAYTAGDNKKDGDAIKYYNYVKYGEDDCDFVNGKWILNKKESDATKTLWYNNVCENHSEVSEMMVYYQCGVKGLDDAIGVIIDKLHEYGIEDKTTMLLYSDHYSYYDSLSHMYKGLDTNNNNNKELNTIPMIISSPGLKKYNATVESKFIENNRFCSAYDVVPTLFDLLGVRFNENLYLGNSLFKPLETVFTDNGVTKDMVVYYSNTGGLFGDEIYTFDMKTFITSKNYSSETIDLFASECNKLLIKINFIVFMNRYNLYHKITNV